jgi:peptide/nickel transport system permease protein
VGVLLLSVIATLALLAPWLAPFPPDEQLDPASSKLRPPGTRLTVVKLTNRTRPLLADSVRIVDDQLVLETVGLAERRLPLDLLAKDQTQPPATGPPPTAESLQFDQRRYPLGTDQFGRDLWSRLLFGGRISLGIALLAGALSLSIGLTVGTTRALGPPLIDSLLGRIEDALLAFPDLVLILLLAALFRPSILLLICLVGATGWMGLSRIVRGEIRSLRERSWFLAARSLGASPFRLLRSHLLPHLAGTLLADTSLRVGSIVLLETALSFLGFGVQPPTASWGSMIADGRVHLAGAWWLVTLPGIAIIITVLACFLIAEGPLRQPEGSAPGGTHASNLGGVV